MNASELATRLRQAAIEDGDLNDRVDEHCRREALAASRDRAAAMNRAGLEAQVAYLLERGEAAASLLGAYGLELDGGPEDRLEGALARCARALRRLSADPLFEGGVPPFGEGGLASEALRHAQRVLEEQARRRREGHGGREDAGGDG